MYALIPFLGVIGSGIAAIVTALLANKRDASLTRQEPVTVTPEEVAAAAPEIAKAVANASGGPLELTPQKIELWARDARGDVRHGFSV